MAIALDTWLGLMRSEYFETFVPAGGGALRMVVVEDAALPGVATALREQAAASGLVCITIDTAAVKLHMLHNAFFAITKALDWDALIQAQLERITADAGYRWPLPGRRLTMDQLADANGIATPVLRTPLQQQITARIWNDARLAQDFRRAMIALLNARLADDSDAKRDAVLDWLRGDLRALRALKGTDIGARIGRNNARAMLQSLCHFMHAGGTHGSGGRGLFVLLDARRLLQDRAEALGSGGFIYTPGAVMDCYEVLRQIIDDAEHMQGMFVAVLAGHRLINGDAPKRSIGAYTALKSRVWDDVRPRGRDNPLAPLVVLT